MKILYFSNINWQAIKQRPQFIAEGLAAAGNQIDFTCRVPFGKAGSRSEELPAGLKLRTFFVLPLALRFRIIEKINNLFLRIFLTWKKYDLLIVTDPRLIGAIPAALSTPVLYDCMDNNPAFYTGKIRKYIACEEAKLCRKAAHIITSGQMLKQHLMDTYAVPQEKISVVRNAVSDGFLNRLKQAQEPKQSKEIPLVYAGTIDFWFDWEPLISFAKKHPDLEIMLAGPVCHRPKELPENIVLPGPIPHDQVQPLLSRGKVLIIPFRRNDLIDCVDPVKLYEYLSCGKPVVSAYWKELEYFPRDSRLSFYKNGLEFQRIVESILEKQSELKPDYEFAEKNSWKSRVENYLSILKEVTNKK